MRLVTYRHADGPRSAAVVFSDGVDHVLDLPSPLEQILADPGLLDDARAAVAAAKPDQLRALADVQLLPPVRPSLIACLGYNYRGHVADGAGDAEPDPQYPDVFLKPASVVIGPTDAVQLPQTPADVDYEGEIAIVIGRRAKNVALADAAQHIAGYTLFNDVTARDWQRRTSQWALGKSFDTFGPLGPWIVTADAVDVHDLLLEVVRDGVVTVSQSTSTMIFPVGFVVHYLSQVMTLQPGDVISTGTPQKQLAAQRAHRPLADGDAVTVRVAGLGELTTTFRRGTE